MDFFLNLSTLGILRRILIQKMRPISFPSEGSDLKCCEGDNVRIWQVSGKLISRCESFPRWHLHYFIPLIFHLFCVQEATRRTHYSRDMTPHCFPLATLFVKMQGQGTWNLSPRVWKFASALPSHCQLFRWLYPQQRTLWSTPTQKADTKN